MNCPLGHHLLRGNGLYITNPRHISFVRKLFPDFLPHEKVCAKCKHDVEKAYDYKMKRAIELRNASLILSSSSSEEAPPNNNSSVRKSPTESSETTDDNRPTTSAKAAELLKRSEDRQRRQMENRKKGINVLRGARLPHIQPVPRRQQFIHANPDIMNIYLSGTTGG